MMNKTPLRKNKKTVRRKLSSPKENEERVKPTFPTNKRSKIGPSENLLPSVDEAPDETSKSIATDVIDEYCSQEVSSYLSNGLPRVSWQPQAVISPLLNASPRQSYTGIISNAKDSKEAEATSTPYLSRIWKRKSRSRSDVHEDSLSSVPLDTDMNNPAWLDKMYNMVAQLEDGGSRSPTPDALTTIPLASKGYTTLIPKSVVATPPRVKSTDARSPGKHPACTRPSSQPKLESTSSLFSDSFDGFTTDFTLSDADLEEDNSQSFAATLASNDSSSEGKQSTETVNRESKTEPSACPEITSNSLELPTTSCASVVKPQIKSELTLTQVKCEPTTPARDRLQKQPKKASPGTPLRRYSSYESAIKSPCPAETSAPASPQPAVTSTQALIEEKRKLALNKLKNRKGSFVRHKSLDSAVMAAQTSISQPNPSQSSSILAGRAAAAPAADQSASKSMAEIIEEKRKMAAEKLQKHREDGHERPDSLSGSLRQLTPPSSQENTSSDVEGASQSTRSFPSQSQSDKDNKGSSQVIAKSVKIKEELSQTAASGNHSKLFSGKLALDTLLDDLERASPRKSKIQKSSTQPVPTNAAAPSELKAGATRGGVGSRILSSQAASKIKSTASVGRQLGEKPLDDNIKSIIEQKRKLALERLKQTKHHGCC